MIARLWHGRVPAAKAEAYMRLMREVAIPDYRRVAGNLGAYALRHDDGDVVHVVMLTFWETMAAIERFAGADPSLAKYYGFDDGFLIEKERTVVHYEAFDR